jgi:hypothetical protein
MPPEKFINILNKLGNNGWEVIQYEEHNTAMGCKEKDTHYFAFLKKKIDS